MGAGRSPLSGMAPVAALALLLLAATPARAQLESGAVRADEPILLRADTVTYDNANQQVVATGNVEIASGERLLLARQVTYDRARGLVTAQGDLTLMEPDGSVLFADRLELDDTLGAGFVDTIRMLLADNSRFAANSAIRPDARTTELNQAVYSPCEVCSEKNGTANGAQRAPLWQLKAVKVVHDRVRQEIDYRDAWLEFYGLPIAYAPFFRHPDPTVKRKSGFLAPSVGSTSELGVTLETPYFFNIAPDRDFTFSPRFTSKENVLAAGEYRQLTATGGFQIEASSTYVDKRNDQGQKLDEMEFRGHIDAEGRFETNETWRWGFDAERASDDTFLRRYDIDNSNTLTSEVFVEGVRGRNYLRVSSLAFQGLRQTDDRGTTPYVTPLVEYEHVGEPGVAGGRWQFTGNLVSLYRTRGQDTRRASADLGWSLPYIDSSGAAWTLTTQLGADVYWLNDFNNPGTPGGGDENGVEARMTPLAALEWRYPMVRSDASVRQVVEPIVQAVVTPYGGNPSEIPNEDSLSFEFDDSNLFRLNRFPGFDRVESGPRVNYGLRTTLYGQSGGSTQLMLGQVLRLREDDTFARNSGLETNRSDYVARLTVSPASWLELSNRVRLDRDELSLNRNEINLSAGPRWLRFNATYVSLDRELTTDELEAREEVYANMRWNFARFWTLSAEMRRDLAGGGAQIFSSAGIEYGDECITGSLVFKRDFTRDRDIPPSTSIQFRVILKQLG